MCPTPQANLLKKKKEGWWINLAKKVLRTKERWEGMYITMARIIKKQTLFLWLWLPKNQLCGLTSQGYLELAKWRKQCHITSVSEWGWRVECKCCSYAENAEDSFAKGGFEKTTPPRETILCLTEISRDGVRFVFFRSLFCHIAFSP